MLAFKHYDRRWEKFLGFEVTVFFKDIVEGGFAVGILYFDWDRGFYGLELSDSLLLFRKSHVNRIILGDHTETILKNQLGYRRI